MDSLPKHRPMMSTRATIIWVCAVAAILGFCLLGIFGPAKAAGLGSSGGGSSAANTTGYTGGAAAASGKIGEVLSTTVLQASPVSLSTGTAANLTSQLLTAGDWDLTCTFQFTGNGATTVTRLLGSISSTSGTVDSTPGQRADVVLNGVTAFAQGNPGFVVGPIQVNSASSVTRYCVAQAEFGASTLTVYGVIRARRVR